MQTKTINIYSFAELSEQAKKTAISEFQDINVSHDWWDCTYDDAKKIGLQINGFDIEYKPFAKGEFLLHAAEVAQNILSNHGDTCDTYKTAQSFLEDWQPMFNSYMNEDSACFEDIEIGEFLQNKEHKFLNSLLACYAGSLLNEYEYLTIELNDYQFFESGKHCTL